MARRSRNEWKRQHHAPPDWKLESYGPNDGPDYPRCNKKSDVAGFFRKLQTTELYACTKNIFAEVRTSYDPSAENLACLNRYTAGLMRQRPQPRYYDEKSLLAKYNRAIEWTRQARQTHSILSQVLAA